MTLEQFISHRGFEELAAAFPADVEAAYAEFLSSDIDDVEPEPESINAGSLEPVTIHAMPTAENVIVFH